MAEVGLDFVRYAKQRIVIPRHKQFINLELLFALSIMC